VASILSLIPTNARGQTPQGIDSGAYEIVGPSELSFSIKDFYHKCVIDKDGGKPVGGEIGELICNGQSIELANHRFEDGFISTRDYGRIKIRFSASLSEGSSFSIWLTAGQKEALTKATRAEGDTTAEESDPFAYDPITTETERLLVPSRYASIREAVAAAKDGATIVISPGIYRECLAIANKSLALRSTNPDDPNVVSSTVVDGGGQDSTIILENGNSKICGLTIRGGFTNSKGGGIRVVGKSSPLIKGNIIENNRTVSLGGGILLMQTGEPRIVGNTIRNNKAQGGGGIYGISSTVYMKGNAITENTAEKGGGGLWFQECKGVFTGNTVGKNRATAGGGIYLSTRSSFECTRNTIKENTATVAGGVFVIDHCKLTFSGNQFTGNRAEKAAGAIAIAVQSMCTLTGNTFERNEAAKGGVGMVQEASIQQSDNKFTDNKPDNEILK